MGANTLLSELFAETVSDYFDPKTKQFYEHKVTEEIRLVCKEFLTNEEDYLEFKKYVFKYFVRKRNKFRKTKEYSKLFPERMI